MNCRVCHGEGWVCEEHPKVGWQDGKGCCGAPGMPCQCNDADPPWHHMDVRGMQNVKGKIHMYTPKGVYQLIERKGKKKK